MTSTTSGRLIRTRLRGHDRGKLTVLLLTVAAGVVGCRSGATDPVSDPVEPDPFGSIAGQWRTWCCGVLDSGSTWDLELIEDSTGAISGTASTTVVPGLLPPGSTPSTYSGHIEGMHEGRNVSLMLTYDGYRSETWTGRRVSSHVIRGLMRQTGRRGGDSLDLVRRLQQGGSFDR